METFESLSGQGLLALFHTIIENYSFNQALHLMKLFTGSGMACESVVVYIVDGPIKSKT